MCAGVGEGGVRKGEKERQGDKKLKKECERE